MFCKSFGKGAISTGRAARHNENRSRSFHETGVFDLLKIRRNHE